MELSTFKSMMETPIYSSLDEIFDKAGLSEVEKEAFIRNKDYCEYWLLRSKQGYLGNFFPEKTNFIKRLARVINHLESDLVSGNKKHKIKELFGGNNPIHNVYKTKNGYRATERSPRIEDTYFELMILSFFVEKGYKVELAKDNEPGRRIPEFVVNLNTSKLSIEAKNVNADKIMDHIFGDSFIEGFDYSIPRKEQEKGYEKVKLQIEKTYENAMYKYQSRNANEQFIVFIDIYHNNLFLGNPTNIFLNSLKKQWCKQNLNDFAGLVIPEEQKTNFIQNNQCSEKVLHELLSIGIEDFHTYVPK